jgi:hypothetical protein
MCRENFELEKDEEILTINSPKEHCDGPYVVVYKSVEERWAIVALTWDKLPALAIRWFWGKSGNPVSRGYPTWFVIPSILYNAILNGLPLAFLFRDKINRFLRGEISGNQLKEGE